jgi:hypothetical protein
MHVLCPISRAAIAIGLMLCAQTVRAADPPKPSDSPKSSVADPAISSLENRFAGQVLGYGWTHGVEKVFRADRPFRGEIGGTLKTELAANEYEGVQLVLRSTKPLAGVRVSVSDLVATTEGDSPIFAVQKSGQSLSPAVPKRIAAGQIEVLPVGYVNTKKPPYGVDYVGWWPDPLLDFLTSFNLDAGVWQPVWLDVHAAADQPAGLYKGTVTVRAEGVADLTIPLEVTVWDFAVPKEHHLPLAVTFFEDMLRGVYSKDPAEWEKYSAYCRDKLSPDAVGAGEARRLVEIRRKCHDLLLAHHLTPDNIYGSPPRIDDVKRWKAAGVTRFNILHVTSIGDLKKGDPYPAAEKKRILDALADYVPKLEKEGLLDLAYIYGFDEIHSNQFAAVKDIFGEIKRRYSTIPLMTTAYDHSYGRDTGLDPFVDVWVPLTKQYDASGEAIEAARKRGRQVWWYICCSPHHPYANWFVEYSAAEHRLLMGFMAQRFDTQGFLYYSLNFWCTNREVQTPDGKTAATRNAPFTEPINRGPLTNSDGKSFDNFNGDGLIFYPGPNGPLATIRMKCIRDGLEDYEYLWLLKRAVAEAEAGKRPASPEWLARAKAALAVDPSLVRSLTEFSTDGGKLLAARREIARLLMEK